MTRPTEAPPFVQVISLHDAAKPTPPVAETPVVVAKHGGRCGGSLCRSPIRPGEEIQKIDGSWHHAECVPIGVVEAWGRPAEAA